jgi:hypothetical protein
MPVVEIDVPSAEILAGQWSLLSDLKFVSDCCERLLQLHADEARDGVVVQALWTSALVAYARCFASGKRPGIREADLATLEGEPVAFHRFLIDMRNKHIAHSVNSFEDVRIGAILSPEGSPTPGIEGIATMCLRHIAGDAEAARQLGFVASFLRRKTGEEAKAQTTKVHAEAKALDIAELYSRPRLRATAPGSAEAALPRRQPRAAE